MGVGLVPLFRALQRQLALGGNPFHEFIFSSIRANGLRLNKASFSNDVSPIDRVTRLKAPHVLVGTHRLLDRSLIESAFGTSGFSTWLLRGNADRSLTFFTRRCFRTKACNQDHGQNESRPVTRSQATGRGPYGRTIGITGRKGLLHDATFEIRSKKSTHLSKRPHRRKFLPVRDLAERTPRSPPLNNHAFPGNTGSFFPD